MLMYPPGLVRRSPHSFPECISDFAFAGWIPVIGDLQKLLARGEYDPLCPAPLFESNFLQVTKRGELVDMHNRASLVTLGIAATSPALLLPDVMILARPTDRPQGEPLGPKGAHGPPELELTRLIPLELVSLYLHDVGEQRLKLRLATGRVYYLQLCAPRGEERPLFSRWLRLIYLLQAPPGSRTSAPSWHSSDLRSHPAKPPLSQRLQPIREEEEPGALVPRLREPPGSGSRPPTQEQLSRRQRPASPTRGQQPATQSVAGRGAGRLEKPSTASVRRSPSTIQFDGLSGSRTKVADPWMQSPVSRERSYRSQPYLEGSSREPIVERSRGQLNVAIPSGEQGGVSSRSQAGSLSQHGASAASKASGAPGSPERSRASVGVGCSEVATASLGVGRSEVATASVGVGRSEVATASLGVGRSLPSTASVAAGPSRLASARLSRMDGQMEPGRRSGERNRAQLGHASSAGEQGGSRSRSQRGSSATSGPPRAAMAPSSHERPSGSMAPSFAEQASSPVAPAPPERSQLSVGVGPSEVATASVAVGPSGQRSRSSPRLGTRSRETSGEGVKGKAQSSSGHVSQKRLSREKGSDSTGKFKSALSSAKDKGSLTFVTIYSALSNSLDKVTGGKLSQRRSREDAKTQLSSKSSKRVTISGVVEMSGQRSPELSSVAPSTVESKGRSDGEQGPAGSGAALGWESDRLSRAQPGGSRATVGPSSPEKSRASVGVGRSAVTTASVAAAPSRLGSATVGPSSPEKSRASVGVGRSAVTMASVAAGPSRLGSATVGPSSPEKSRASVGVGRSAVATASVGVGRSAMATASVAVGPSRLGSAQPVGTDGEMEPGRRSREPSAERSQALRGHVSPSTEQGMSRSQSPVGRPSQPESSAVSGASGAAGPLERSKVSVAAGPSEKSRVSAAAGPSEMATVSVAMGPSELGPRSSARPSERDRLSLPGERSSKRGRRSGGRISSPNSTGEAGTPGTVASLGMDGDDVSRGTSKRSRASVAPGFPERSRPVAPDSAERSRASVAPGSPERSRASVVPGSAEKSSASRAPGSAERSRPVAPGSAERSRASVVPGSAKKSSASKAPGSAERSRVSMAAGPSEMAAVSVAVGRSEPRSLSSAQPTGTDVRVPSDGRSWLSSLSSGAPLGTEAGDASPGSARRGRSGGQSQSWTREKGGAHSQSPLGQPSQTSHRRSAVSVAVGLSKPAVVSVAVGPSGARRSELDRQGDWGPGRASVARSRSKGRQEDKQDPSVGHPASRGGSDRAATRTKSQ